MGNFRKKFSKNNEAVTIRPVTENTFFFLFYHPTKLVLNTFVNLHKLKKLIVLNY